MCDKRKVARPAPPVTVGSLTQRFRLNYRSTVSAATLAVVTLAYHSLFQEIVKRPRLVDQPRRLRRRFPQHRVNPAPVVIREEQCQGVLEHGPLLREGVGFAGKTLAVLPQRPVEPFDLDWDSFNS